MPDQPQPADPRYPHGLRPGVDDVPRTDETGDVDLSLIEYNLSLTPAERLEQHYHARMLAERLRAAGERYYGSPHPVLEEDD